jgi:hypothetical protein
MSLRVFFVGLFLFGLFATAANAQDDPGDRMELEAETTAFDLYIGDRYSGLILADYSDDWFEISVVGDALDQLERVKEPERLRPLLEGRIPGKRELEGVGVVSYDLSSFRIIIDPVGELLKGNKLNLENTLPTPERKLTLQQRIQAAGSGDPRRRVWRSSHLSEPSQLWGGALSWRWDSYRRRGAPDKRASRWRARFLISINSISDYCERKDRTTQGVQR